MKHICKKTLAVLLCLLMTCSCFVFSGSAATKENVPQFGKMGGYLAIGDSIGKGCGADGSYIDRYGNPQKECGGQYNDNDWRYVKGCYAAQIAEAVGCEAPEDMRSTEGNFWPCTFGGMTTAVALDLYGVDDGYSDTTLNYEYYDWALKYFGYENSSVGAMGETFDPATCGITGNIIDVTQRASLITIELGMCDIFYRAYRVIAKGGLLADGFDIDFTDVETLKEILTSAIKLLNEGYDNWEKQYPLLLERVIELNPNATIVLVGAFNMVDQMTILDQTSFPIGSLFSSFTDKMNKKYKEWAKKYNVLYADINNTESLATEEDWSLIGEFLSGNNSFPGSHPTQNGYDYITRQILGVIPPVEEIKNLTVDIGRFTADTVSAIYVNGIKVREYEINGHILSIPYSGPLALTMKLEVVGTNGAKGAQYYTLSYIGDGCYSAEREYGNNDIKELITRPITLFKFLFEKIMDLLGIKLK